jgi:hypothetical protein
MADSMTTETELLELAERCEKATGDDTLELINLHCDICHATGIDSGEQETGFVYSLDAAMTLVPEGWFLQGLSERNASGSHNWRWKAELWSPDSDANVRGIARQVHADKCAPALALCAAALKARATTQTPEKA